MRKTLRTTGITELAKLFAQKIRGTSEPNEDLVLGEMPIVPEQACGQQPRSSGFQHDFRK